AQNGFPREVPVARVLDDRPGGHLADALPLQRVPFDQGPEGGREHVLVGARGVGGHDPGEGDAGAAENRHTARSVHGETSCAPMLRRAVGALLPAPLPDARDQSTSTDSGISASFVTTIAV